MCKKFGVTEKRFVKVLVDDIIEQIPDYQRDMQRIKRSADMDEQELQSELTHTYFKYRREYGDFMSESILRRALIEKYNVIWETTGNNIDWAIKTIETEAKSSGYYVVLVYPFVSEDELVKRVKLRAQNSDNPRKPDERRIRSNVKAAQENFEELSRHVDKVLVYNNDGAPEDLSVMLEMDIAYKGWCDKSDKKCKRGVSTTISCNLNKLNGIQEKLTDPYRKFLFNACHG